VAAAAEATAPARGAARLGHKQHKELEWCRRKGLGASLGCGSEQEGSSVATVSKAGGGDGGTRGGGARPPL
jgi:hypothetical protein